MRQGGKQFGDPSALPSQARGWCDPSAESLSFLYVPNPHAQFEPCSKTYWPTDAGPNMKT